VALMKAPNHLLTAKYGTREVMLFQGCEGTVRRLDLYRPFDVSPREPWNAEIEEYTMCLDAQDFTHVVSTYAAQIGDKGPWVRNYDSKCSCCYLNISHTVAKHDAALGVTCQK